MINELVLIGENKPLQINNWWQHLLPYFSVNSINRNEPSVKANKPRRSIYGIPG